MLCVRRVCVYSNVNSHIFIAVFFSSSTSTALVNLSAVSLLCSLLELISVYRTRTLESVMVECVDKPLTSRPLCRATKLRCDANRRGDAIVKLILLVISRSAKEQDLVNHDTLGRISRCSVEVLAVSLSATPSIVAA